MSRFHAYTRLKSPGLHIWREGTPTKLYLRPLSQPTGPGWVEFEYGLEPGIFNDVCFMLFDFNEAGHPDGWEKDEHQRKVPRGPTGDFASEVWFAQDAQRVLTSDPRQNSAPAVRMHVISQTRYRPSQLFLWDPATRVERRVSMSGEDSLGPFFEVNLTGDECFFFLFKFIRRVGGAIQRLRTGFRQSALVRCGRPGDLDA